MITDIGSIAPLGVNDANVATPQNQISSAPTSEQIERFRNAMAETRNMSSQLEEASNEVHLLLENISGTLLKDQVLKLTDADQQKLPNDMADLNGHHAEAQLQAVPAENQGGNLNECQVDNQVQVQATEKQQSPLQAATVAVHVATVNPAVPFVPVAPVAGTPSTTHGTQTPNVVPLTPLATVVGQNPVAPVAPVIPMAAAALETLAAVVAIDMPVAASAPEPPPAPVAFTPQGNPVPHNPAFSVGQMGQMG
ncbi:MAG: hypothetical protein J5746_08675, partial [Victivallales bacterium]|nr:hypothetical protein [Victivallales bacterium]